MIIYHFQPEIEVSKGTIYSQPGSNVTLSCFITGQHIYHISHITGEEIPKAPESVDSDADLDADSDADCHQMGKTMGHQGTKRTNKATLGKINFRQTNTFPGNCDKYIKRPIQIQIYIFRKSNPGGEVGFARSDRDKQHKSAPWIRQPAVCDSRRG